MPGLAAGPVLQRLILQDRGTIRPVGNVVLNERRYG